VNNFWFYWVMWGFWIISAFFLKRGSQRTWICVALLVIILFSSISLTVGESIQINLAFFAVSLAGCSFLSGRSFFKVAYIALSSFILMLVDILAQIYWLYDPAILMILPKWTFIIASGVLVLFLNRDFWMRIATVLIGLSQGEVLQSFVFYPYDQTIGDTDYLVTLSLVLLLIVGWEALTQAAALLKFLVDRPSIERVKNRGGLS
jgi:hypothetical protein